MTLRTYAVLANFFISFNCSIFDNWPEKSFLLAVPRVNKLSPKCSFTGLSGCVLTPSVPLQWGSPWSQTDPTDMVPRLTPNLASFNKLWLKEGLNIIWLQKWEYFRCIYGCLSNIRDHWRVDFLRTGLVPGICYSKRSSTVVSVC